MLFKPFNIGTWFTLGFAAFLSQLGEGGSNFNLPDFGSWGGGGGGGGGRGGTRPAPAPRGTGGDPVTDVLAELTQLFLRNAYWIVPLVIVGLLLGLGLLWLRARGKFIFVDGVARNYASIVEPWKRLAPQANSYFRFELLVYVLIVLAVLAIGLISYLIAMPDLRAGRLTGTGIAAVAVGAGLIVPLIVLYLLVTAVAENFLVPLMYLRAQPIGPAWGEFRSRMLPGNAGIITAYFLLRGVLNVAIGFLMFFGMCLTCLIAAIPYLGTVMFLPVFVFMRAYSLYFFEQFGPGYQLMSDTGPRPVMAFPVIFNTPPEVPPRPAPPEPPGAPPPIPPEGDRRGV
jgi:hypothetical protein